jgi:hypothetical protein
MLAPAVDGPPPMRPNVPVAAVGITKTSLGSLTRPPHLAGWLRDTTQSRSHDPTRQPAR